MRKPVQRVSDGLSRGMRRDIMVGTAALVLIEAGLGTAAAAMSADHGPEQQQPDQAEEDRPTRPVGGSDGVPDTQVGMSMGLRPVPQPPSDDYDASLLNYGLGSAGGHARGFGGVGANISAHGNTAPHHASGGFDTGIVRPPSFQDFSDAVAPDSGSSDKPASPPATTPEMAVKVGTDDDDVILGSDDNDYAFGRGGSDHMLGGGGNDRLLGGDGDDVLVGGAGNDGLVGEKGNDELTGDAGADTFFFRAGYGNDTVTDFQANGELDVIDVSKSEFANFAALSSHLADTDLGVVLTLDDGSTLTLKHVTKASLTGNDFHFGV